MFSIQCLRIRNFRSYAGCHSFDFPTENGLYFLTGKNLLDPGVGANAVGKSSLLDAVFWCLYGKTTRGLRSLDVLTRGVEEKYYGVSVDVTVGDQTCDISRTHNPNKLELAGKTVDQSAINKFLRLSPEAFLYSVILPQYGTSFFDLTPSEKLTVFSDIMGLEYWMECSQKAAERANEVEQTITKAQQSLAKISGQIESSQADLLVLQEKEQGYEKSKMADLRTWERELAQNVHALREIEKNIKETEKVLSNAVVRLASALSKSTCPECKQRIPSKDLTSLQQNKVDWEGKLNKLSRDKSFYLIKIASIEKSLKDEGTKSNPYAELIADKKDILNAYRDKLRAYQDNLDGLNEKCAAVSFWTGGFKRIRLFIIEEALSQLELEVNNALISLGLNGWKVAFDVERENKSGGITKGFTVLIYPPKAEDHPVRYESYSGGETQRLRLAGDLGLANLIMERNGLANTIEFYDEPSQHLSQEGLLDLAETLAERAATQGKRIFLVDHHLVDFSGFAGIYTVVKDANGSHITAEAS